MLSLIPTMAPWPVTRATQTAINKLITVDGSRSASGIFNPSGSADDNKLYLPNQPLMSVDRALNVASHFSMSLASQTPWAVGDKLVGNSSYASYGRVSKDGAVSIYKTVGSSSSYRFGALLHFKQNLYEEVGGSWIRHTNSFDLNGTTTTIDLTANTVGESRYWAKNANCIIGCTSTSARGAMAYASWAFGTFIGYNLSIETNSTFHYIGNNVFQVTNYFNTTSKLVFVGQAGGASVLLTLDPVKASRVAHIGDYLFFIGSGNLLKASPLPSVSENNLLVIADSRAYAQSIVDATNSPNAVLVETVTRWDHMIKWGDDRLVLSVGNSVATQKTFIYEANNNKQSTPFSIKANQHVRSTAVQKCTGYQSDPARYGFGLDTEATIVQPVDAFVVLCCDWYQQIGDNGYNGFSLGIAGDDSTSFLEKYRGIKVNNKVFFFTSAVAPRGVSVPGYSTSPAYRRWTWSLTLAGFISGQTYACELLPR